MAAKFEQSKVFNVPINIVITQIRDFNFAKKLNLELKSENPTNNGLWYRFHHGVTFSSWGEKITITVIEVQQNATQVTVHSECGMPTQAIDWGKNKSNVCNIFEHLGRMIQTVQISTYDSSVTVAPDSLNKADDVCYCTNCGWKMVKTDKFCGSCGNKNLIQN